MDEGLTKVYKNFEYLIKKADNEDDFEIDFNNAVLKEINDDDKDYERIDKFIKFTLATYPHYFDNIQEKKESNVKKATEDDDVRLKKKFLKEIKFNISLATDTLLEKNILNDHNDEIISDINYMTSKSISKQNLQDYIKSDINFFLARVQVNINELSKYLRDEILLRIKDNHLEYNIDTEKELNLLKNQEKESLYEQLHNMVKNNESAEEFWDSY